MQSHLTHSHRPRYWLSRILSLPPDVCDNAGGMISGVRISAKTGVFLVAYSTESHVWDRSKR